MTYIIKRISSRAMINKEIHPHQLRHSYATHLLNNGGPIDVIQSLLGHEKSETTRIYAQLSGSIRREFYRIYFKEKEEKKATDFPLLFYTIAPDSLSEYFHNPI